MDWRLRVWRKRSPVPPDRLKAYGLDPPQLLLDFQLQNGDEALAAMGNADFSGDSTYSIVDGSKSVSLLPKSLYSQPR